MSAPTQSPSVAALEAEIAAARERLARTVGELAKQATPKAIVRRQVDSAKARFTAATMTPEGGVRIERVAALALIGVALIGLGLARRRRRRH